MSASVAVYRSIYTEDRFKQAYGSDDGTSGSLRLRDKIAGRCRCSKRACLHLLRERVPIFSWLPRYKLKKWILGDTIAGLTVGILHIPQGEETLRQTREVSAGVSKTFNAHHDKTVHCYYANIVYSQMYFFFIVSDCADHTALRVLASAWGAGIKKFLKEGWVTRY